MHTIKSLFDEINEHLLNDSAPSAYLNSIIDHADFHKYPFRLLLDLRKTEQSPIHHPEGNVWNHTLLVVDEAAKTKQKSKNPKIFMWAALLHDIGKPPTTKIRKGKITSYDHDKVGAKLAEEFLNFFHCDKDFTAQVCALIRYHMQILFVVKKMPFADIKGMHSITSFEEIALLGYCDRMGRTGADTNLEESNINQFLKICSNY